MIHRNMLIVATTRRLLACWYRFGGTYEFESDIFEGYILYQIGRSNAIGQLKSIHL